MRDLDPRSKLLMVICISTLAMVHRDPLWLLFLLLFSILMLLLVSSDVKKGMQPLRKILPLLALLFLVQCIFTRHGEPLLTAYGIGIVTDVGFNTGLEVMLRIMIIVVSAMILLSSSEGDFLLALVQWKVPYEIAFMVMAGLRFLPLLREEALNVYYAVQMRGTELQKIPIGQKLKLYTLIMLPILSGAIYRAEQTAMAMEARAFRAFPQRTYMKKLRLKKIDYCLQIGVVLVSVSLL